MRIESNMEDMLPGVKDLVLTATMHGFRCEHPDPAVAMDGVVPSEELTAIQLGLLNGCEPVGEVGTVLQGLEYGFGERVVVGHMRPGM